MSHVLFYEKPGCANNTRQQHWLAAAGHQVEVRSLLDHPWTRGELRSYFGERPVAEWFNRAASRVKSGEVVPEQLAEDAALDLLLAEPLLIRRPLIEAEGQRRAGFDVEEIHAWLGLPRSVLTQHAARNAEACLKPAHGPECSSPR